MSAALPQALHQCTEPWFSLRGHGANSFKTAIKIIATQFLFTWAGAVFSQTSQSFPVANVVQLSASAAMEVQQDLLSITLNTTRDASDAALVQNQLKLLVDAALVEIKKTAQPGQLDVRTGNFSLSPRYGRDGKPIGWQGSAELVLEGRDFVRISTAAARAQGLTVGQVAFSLSREQRAQAEKQAQALAIDAFKVRAADIARGFGFAGYTLREISVNAADTGMSPRPRLMAMEARAASLDAPVPVEAGKTAVWVTVSGSVQLK
jgi:predicted secreted protein